MRRIFLAILLTTSLGMGLLPASGQAAIPHLSQMPKVLGVAKIFSELAQRAYIAALENADDENVAEYTAIQQLSQILQPISNFKTSVEIYQNNPNETLAPYVALKTEYEIAQRSFKYLNAYEFARYMFEDMNFLFKRLSYYYSSKNVGENWNSTNARAESADFYQAIQDTRWFAEHENAFEGDTWKSMAVSDLRDIEQQARTYQKKLETEWADPMQTIDMVRVLRTKTERARASLKPANFTSRITDQFLMADQHLLSIEREYPDDGGIR